MAKKFGKILLFTAAIGTAAAAAYYYMQKKDAALESSDDNDEDYDDFSEDLEDDLEETRSYVSLNRDTTSEKEDDEETGDEGDFTPLTEQVNKLSSDATEETVEEFFDEEDGTEEGPPLQDN